MSIREIRLHWPRAEQALADGEEIVVTRDRRPVARLLPFEPVPPPERARFDPEAHAAWLARFWRGRRAVRGVDEMLAEERAERR